jgi:hypothetical protein
MQLSATPNKWRFIALSFATGILVHMFFIGLTIAWAASKGPAVGRALARRTAESG